MFNKQPDPGTSNGNERFIYVDLSSYDSDQEDIYDFIKGSTE